MLAIKEICQQVPVIPVLVVKDVAHAVPLAEALVSGGLHVLEVTLRTPAALEVIRAMSTVQGAIVGAGTVLNAQDVQAAKQAGATFAVSPGATESLLAAAETEQLALLPGASTASEVMYLLERQYTALKFFPAESVGGIGMLKSLYGPLPAVSFCPTGGISPRNAADYLALPNVMCVGGSWLAPEDLVQAGLWDSIAALAEATQTLGTRKA
ncbi:bifunctional 4-hydroxy-2-oxoglutarate aldolase/2-dehydro-3-deoxy-phosphogluconate aldolase [Thiolinea disciformis]|uniref:bifunctional 4-hydroxy-2-oxoglutarate aldolase/2-dehydro-3-deoxy-phosphogluconate aldolase n=1 Tax=Thiolinea disciformis TaxID=125614 RepID=UPI00036CBEED|nr:bifunctional 4-hydroxy-2-oxoglutarate aldolase/2-dehydro-3-deoxy-phosphogluconate aldolase [Thiolinea disciformis]